MSTPETRPETGIRVEICIRDEKRRLKCAHAETGDLNKVMNFINELIKRGVSVDMRIQNNKAIIDINVYTVLKMFASMLG